MGAILSSISCVINGHNEGKILKASIESALLSADFARSKGHFVSLTIVLDSPNRETLDVASHFSNLATVHEVDFKDLGRSRNFGISISNEDYIAFLDGDDLWSRNWLAAAAEADGMHAGSVVWHPKFSVYFSGNPVGKSGFVYEHIDQESDKFRRSILASQNYWTALSFARKTTFQNVCYLEVDPAEKSGFEDWSFNLKSIQMGYIHKVVPQTVHFIRQKGSSSMKRAQARRKSIFQSFDIWSDLGRGLS